MISQLGMILFFFLESFVLAVDFFLNKGYYKSSPAGHF